MAAAERIQQRRASHVQMHSHQSSSVPSTPHQQPSDLHFSSRSPSPSQSLSTRSPRSATAEAHTRPFVQRAAPVVCKFETGAEFRKRRVPYKDGGNDPLPTPKQEPKKTLEPDEEDKLSGDMRELYDRLLPTQESEERKARLVKKLEKILNDEWPGNDIKVNVFGSSGNLLASSDSDVDICIITSLKKLESMHSLATVLHQHGMERVICRAAAKVPIVKIWDPELQLACDMNVNNTQALENTRMIKTYVQLDERVRPLAKIVKYWTKQRILNDAAFGGTISSYTWICMIINFLQTRKPPILPSLQLADVKLRSSTDGVESHFADDLDQLRSRCGTNKSSLGSLLFHFFRYYGYELDYTKSVMSVKQGRVISRKEKGWHQANFQEKEARVRLCVEEPFNTDRNLGNSADDYAFSGIHEEIRRAFDLVAAGKLDECCAEYVFPPEEKSIFQKPVPRPKPTLTRSVSQSGGRTHANSVGAKGGPRNTRASSSQRGNNRRASSGAAFGNPRMAFMSPQLGMAGAEYLGNNKPQLPNDQLHEQLYQQYQYLQAQQELLRSQLMQQQQAHALALVPQQTQGQSQEQNRSTRVSDFSTASHRQRQFAHTISTPRSVDSGPSTAPLLPGYLYHYPARHPAPNSPLSQTRMQEGSMTNPSSPSSTATMPPLRRGMQRGPIPEGMAPAAVRSQSQPGRAFPGPVALQSMVHPGYDVSGAIGAPYLVRQGSQTGSQLQYGFDLAGRPVLHGQVLHDNPMPKEYVGYYMSQSPQLIPQMSVAPQQVPVLRDLASQQRTSSPDILPPILPDGSMRRRSRSPPAGPHRRSSSLSTQSRSDPLPQKPFADLAHQREQAQIKHPHLNPTGAMSSVPVIANSSRPLPIPAAPVIVSSTPRKALDSAPADRSASTTAPGTEKAGNPEIEVLNPATSPQAAAPIADTNGEAPATNLSADEAISNARSHVETNGGPVIASSVSGGLSPSGRARPPAPLSLSPKAAGEQGPPSDIRSTQISPPVVPPLLSPVAELQTPSPTSSRDHGSPKNDAKVAVKNAQIANGRLNERVNGGSTNGTNGASALPPPPKPAEPGARPENAWSKPLTHTSPKQNGLPPTSGAHQLLATPQQVNQWQQATARKHKKVKSLGSVATALSTKELPFRAGEIMPARESERKGG